MMSRQSGKSLHVVQYLKAAIETMKPGVEMTHRDGECEIIFLPKGLFEEAAPAPFFRVAIKYYNRRDHNLFPTSRPLPIMIREVALAFKCDGHFWADDKHYFVKDNQIVQE
jgi:hypothetical protein